MPDFAIRPARFPDDSAALARLCWAYRDVLVNRSGHVPGFMATYYDRNSYTDLIADLPKVHARPKGDILVVENAAGVAGCAMYYPIAPKTCEIKRIFLDASMRGTGAAAALVQTAMQAAREDGYARMVLDTIHTLEEAIALYQRLGFTPCDPFYEPDPAFIQTLRFFDYALV